jgi:hypothetical protein
MVPLSAGSTRLFPDAGPTTCSSVTHVTPTRLLAELAPAWLSSSSKSHSKRSLAVVHPDLMQIDERLTNRFHSGLMRWWIFTNHQ